MAIGVQKICSLHNWKRVLLTTVLMVILLIGLFCLLDFSSENTVLVGNTETTETLKRRPTHPTFVSRERDNSTNSSYDLMIFSYMRSGSTMTGEVFQENSNFFFVFEPLLHMLPYSYLTTTSVCKMRDLECRNEDFDDKYHDAMYLFNDIFDCRLRRIPVRTLEAIIKEKKSGPNWLAFIQCSDTALSGFNMTLRSLLEKRRTDNSGRNIIRIDDLPHVHMMDHCFQKLEEACRLAKARVTKVLRLSMTLIPRLLLQLPNLKILLLVRDPRAITNSRIITEWFPVNDTDPRGVLENVRSLCRKMEDDIQTLRQLVKQFSDRIVVYRLEDVVVDPPELFKDIFKFINLRKTGVETQMIQEKYINRSYVNFAEKWKNMLKSEFKDMVDTHCQNVLRYYEYVT